MKTIGLIGGMSFESTAVYYNQLNSMARDTLGGLASAELLLHSVNFADIVALQQSGRWDEAARHLAGIARRLEQAGADCVLICTNTMHKVAKPVRDAISVPLIDIIDETALALKAKGAKRPLLIATRYTMVSRWWSLRRTRASASTRSFLTNSARVRSSTTPASKCSTSSQPPKQKAPIPSSSAAPRSACCSIRTICPCPDSIRRASTANLLQCLPWEMPWLSSRRESMHKYDACASARKRHAQP
jgi:aspartate racemase